MTICTLSKDRIREICLAHGYTVKPGNNDLKDYVYECAHAIAQAAIAEHTKTQRESYRAYLNIWASEQPK